MALRRAPMVGRDHQLAALREAVAAGQDGHPAAVLVEGPAGMGKTRLVTEFLAAVHRDPHPGELLVLRGTCSTDRGDVPWGPFLDVLRDLRRSLGTDEFLELAGRRAGDLALLDPGIPVDAPPVGPDRGRMLGVLSGLLLDAAVKRPVVLVVEDVHWADEGSRHVLEYLVRSVRTEPLTMVLTVRTEEATAAPVPGIVDELARTGNVSRLELTGLDRDGVAELVGHLRPAASDPNMLDTVIELSAGVPLFVEEVAAAVEAGADVSHLSGLLHGHRLAALSPEALQVVETAAVAVTPPPAVTLLAACTLDGEVFDRALGAAVGAGVLSRRRPLIEFRHAVLREATLERMLPHRERELHRRWAEVLEREAEGLENAVTVAHHRLVAGEPSAALAACARAADLAGRASGFAVQLEMLHQVARLWSRVERPGDLAGRDLADVFGQALEAAYFASADATEMQRLARRARELLAADSPPVRRAWLELLVLRSRYSQGEQIPVEELLTVVADIPAEPPSRERVVACAEAASRLLQAGRHRDAEPFAEEGARSARALGLAGLEADALRTEAALHLHHGRYDDAVQSAARACRIADATGDPLSRADALQILSTVLWHAGAAAAVLETIRLAVDVLGGDRPGPIPGKWGLNSANLAEVLIERGEWIEAQRVLDRVLAVSDLPARVTGFACRLSGHLRLWRDGLDPDYVAGGAPCDPDASLETMALQDFVPSRYTAADISSHHRDLVRTRAELRGPLADDRTVQLPEALYNLLGVAARTEADVQCEGWPDPDPGAGDWAVRQVEKLLGLLTPAGPVQEAQHAHVATDLARRAHRDNAAMWAHVVTLWRRVPHPRSLALALVRLGTVAAESGDKKAARNALAEALEIAERLGACPLETSVYEAARQHDVRIGTLAGARTAAVPFTSRELEVLQLLSGGASNADIAQHLFISPKTVSVHVSHILGKLGVSSRTAAAALAHKAGLLTIEDTEHAGPAARAAQPVRPRG